MFIHALKLKYCIYLIKICLYLLKKKFKIVIFKIVKNLNKIFK